MENPQPDAGSPRLAHIEFRIQQLQNRLFLLQGMQHFMHKAEDKSAGGDTEEMNSEDSEDLYELEAIQTELEELLVKKEELEKLDQSSELSEEDTCPTYKRDPPCGGIYTLPPVMLPPLMLPPLKLPQEENTVQEHREEPPPEIETPQDPELKTPPAPVVDLVDADSLRIAPELTRCPSCEEVILTETKSKVGESTWLVCCLCSMIGCVAGCCAIPFFTKRLKNIHHSCPQCHAHIHTHRPF